MRRTGIFALAALGLLLGACETTSPAQQRAADEAKCRSYGFRRGTDSFAKCLQDIDLDRTADMRSRRDSVMLYGGPRFYGGRYGRFW